MAGPLSKYKKTDGDVVPELLVINFDGIAVDWSWWQRVEVVRVFTYTLCTHGRDQDVSCACLTAQP